MKMRDLQIFAIFMIVIIIIKKFCVMVRRWGTPLLHLLIAVLLRNVEIVIHFITEIKKVYITALLERSQFKLNLGYAERNVRISSFSYLPNKAKGIYKTNMRYQVLGSHKCMSYLRFYHYF